MSIRDILSDKTNKIFVNSIIDEFDADHRMVTLELRRLWSLPEPMIAAYRCRAFADTESGVRLELITAAGAAVVGNTEVAEDQQTRLDLWANAFGMTAEDLQNLAVLGMRQEESVKSLADKMSA